MRSLLQFFRLVSEPRIPCVIKECTNHARYSARSTHYETLMMGMKEGHYSVLPICGRKECLDRMKQIEGTQEIQLTEIEKSVFALRPI